MIRLNSPVCKAAAALLLTLTALAGCGGSDDNPNLPPEGDTTPVLGLAALQGPLTNPANGHVYLTDRSGTTTVIKDADQVEVVASNSVGETVDATPAPVDNQLFIRGEQHLFCIE